MPIKGIFFMRMENLININGSDGFYKIGLPTGCLGFWVATRPGIWISQTNSCYKTRILFYHNLVWSL